MAFKLWVPGRAKGVDANYHPSIACDKCNGTGEGEHKYVRGVGHSHIPCKVCNGSGQKNNVRTNTESVGS